MDASFRSKYCRKDSSGTIHIDPEGVQILIAPFADHFQDKSEKATAKNADSDVEIVDVLAVLNQMIGMLECILAICTKYISKQKQ